jgi:hypothetical protein
MAAIATSAAAAVGATPTLVIQTVNLIRTAVRLQKDTSLEVRPRLGPLRVSFL